MFDRCGGTLLWHVLTWLYASGGTGWRREPQHPAVDAPGVRAPHTAGTAAGYAGQKQVKT